jgi:hypothetical protein
MMRKATNRVRQQQTPRRHRAAQTQRGKRNDLERWLRSPSRQNSGEKACVTRRREIKGIMSALSFLPCRDLAS